MRKRPLTKSGLAGKANGMSQHTILHLCEHFGGAEASLHGVARGFQWWMPLFNESKYRVLLCSRKGRDKAFEEMAASGLSPLVLGYHKLDPRNLWALIRLVKQEKVDLLHAHGYGACMWARLAGHLLQIPVVIHGRCNYGTVPLMQRPIERLLGPRTKYGLAVSESTRQFTINKRYVPADAVRVLYNGILLERIQQAEAAWIASLRHQYGADEYTRVVGVVSRLESYKGHRDAFAALKVLNDSTVQLWVVGDGAFAGELKAEVDRLGLGEQVKFLGFRRDAIQVIQAFDIQLYPSHQEGTPNTLFEGLAVGNPVVASSCDGQGEILEHGVTAEMFEPGDVPEMVRGLKNLLEDAGLREARGKAAKEKSLDFDGHKTVAAMEALYDEILRARR